ncbi:hypothetical protein QA639_25485 [Bradyrhizobium pachyrhizi]|uniref:hypothetical protein n=1 Tax=Bradyrhizobium pachyrhizi TaxID=280333 RepID=UPI0024B0DB3F|nr:hypothetical protein [Bradyrhizobium pachyrhizi]WFU53028.1 hypothetical protein QA639_25485 [Bradyrhizobium pachyrhizi]
MTEQIQTSTKKVRSRGQRSRDIIDAMVRIVAAAQPITGRGVGYKLFNEGLTASMGRADMAGVYRLLKIAREEGTIPWSWIVDESRELEQVASWDDPAQFADCAAISYRRDFWQQQPVRVEVWSEKGTVRGVLQPVLDEYAIGFRVMHGFGSATIVNDVAQSNDDRPLIILYIGDFDPSGMYMSERDIPERLRRYGGNHVSVERIALLRNDCNRLGRRPAFNVSEKKKDPRAAWFRKAYGQWCWELDAMDPNDLRARVEGMIERHIEPVAWERCRLVNEAERDSLREVLESWKAL